MTHAETALTIVAVLQFLTIGVCIDKLKRLQACVDLTWNRCEKNAADIDGLGQTHRLHVHPTATGPSGVPH